MPVGRDVHVALTHHFSPNVVDRTSFEHHVVLQLFDREWEKQTLILSLSVAYKSLAAYRLDQIDLEVVAFGQGIDLLRANSPSR